MEGDTDNERKRLKTDAKKGSRGESLNLFCSRAKKIAFPQFSSLSLLNNRVEHFLILIITCYFFCYSTGGSFACLASY